MRGRILRGENSHRSATSDPLRSQRSTLRVPQQRRSNDHCETTWTETPLPRLLPDGGWATGLPRRRHLRVQLELGGVRHAVSEQTEPAHRDDVHVVRRGPPGRYKTRKGALVGVETLKRLIRRG